MKKVLIPAILGTILLVAGMFAFMPIDKASTVHSTIQATVISKSAAFSDTDWDVAAGEDEKRLTCTAAATINEINFDIDGTLAAGDNIDLVIDPDGAASAVFAAITQVDFFAGVAPADEATLLSTRALDNGVSVDTNGFVSLTLTAEAADNQDERIDLNAFYTSTGTCTWADI
jgi:hypothetical protein